MQVKISLTWSEEDYVSEVCVCLFMGSRVLIIDLIWFLLKTGPVDDYLRCLERGRAASAKMSAFLRRSLPLQNPSDSSKAGWFQKLLGVIYRQSQWKFNWCWFLSQSFLNGGSCTWWKKAYVKDIHGCYYNPSACCSLVLVGGFSISKVWSSGRNCVWRFNLYEELIYAISCSSSS